jgi:hypothetical protein
MTQLNQFVLVSARKSRGADHCDKDDYDVRLGDKSGPVVGRITRGKPLNAPADRRLLGDDWLARMNESGPGWAHELKHDGYRLQIHVRDGRVRLYTDQRS